MLLRQLEYLVAVARERHFGRAATACHVSQPALSEGIRRLETELGVPLVLRGRTVEGLTPEGEAVVAWGRRMLADRDGLEGELQALRGTLAGRLRIGAIPAAMRATTELVGALAAERPQLAIVLHSLTSVEIARRLDEFDLDAGVTYLDNEPLRGVRTVPLATERFVAVAAHGVAPDASPLRWADAARLPLALLTPDMQNRRIIDGAFARAGAAARPAVEADTVPALLDLVAGSGWTTIVAEAWIESDARFVARPLVEPVVEHVIGVVAPDREPLPLATRALLAAARRAGG